MDLFLLLRGEKSPFPKARKMDTLYKMVRFGERDGRGDICEPETKKSATSAISITRF